MYSYTCMVRQKYLNQIAGNITRYIIFQRMSIVVLFCFVISMTFISLTCFASIFFFSFHFAQYTEQLLA